MTKYICKCGRIVTKSTSADNTGNRNTAGCEGCPYLLPWGPVVWDEIQKGYAQDVKGYECRMSPTIEYTTTYHGRADDKCSLHIVSLDLDFLDEVQAWIYDHAADTLTAGFSRGSMRGIEFSNKGRYSLSVLCAQNRKGVAAKAALLAEFFGPDKRRRDMTPEQEKAHILAAIEAGKARAQRKENTMVYKDPSTGWLYRVSPKPGEDGCFCIEYLDPVSSAVWKPDYKAAQGHPRGESVRSRLAYLAEEKGWEPVEDAPVKSPADVAEDAQQCAPTLSDCPFYSIRGYSDNPDGHFCSLCGSLKRAHRTCLRKYKDDWHQCDIFHRYGGQEKLESSIYAAPASHADVGAATQSLSAAEPVSSVAQHSDSLAFDYSGLDDQTVADLHLAEREYAGGKKMAEMGLRRMADAVAIAHDALCITDATICRTGGKFASPEQSFSSWCESMGLNRKAAERLLQVSKLMDNSSPREQKVLEELTPSVLYEASRPSAEPEAVEALKSKQVTTLKEYRALEAQIKAEREAREKAEQEVALASEREEKARAAAHQYHVQYEEVNGQRNRLLDEQGVYISRITEAEERAKAAEAAAQDAAYTIQRKQEAIEELDEIARERLEQIEALEKGRTIEAQVSDPEEVRLQAEALARELAATETAGLQEENRRLRSRAPAIRQAKILLVAVMAQVLRECDKLEADDEEGSDALIEVSGELLSWSADIKERVMAAAGYEEDGYDTDEN